MEYVHKNVRASMKWWQPQKQRGLNPWTTPEPPDPTQVQPTPQPEKHDTWFDGPAQGTVVTPPPGYHGESASSTSAFSDLQGRSID